MSDDRAFFVQFPHPGQEHRPTTDEMPWNTGPHRRKFLRAPGRYMEDGSVRSAELVFWGEWEPPSTIEERWPPAGRLPRALHQPWWPRRALKGRLQNTDPWVFGPHMRYSNCKQVQAQGARPTSMQRLTRGSVICFGSTIDGDFCADTVFVVASTEPWSVSGARDLQVDAAFRACTIVATPDSPFYETAFTLYRGATVDEPVDGMFSFVPARRADAPEPRFARPAVEHEYINPASRQSTWGSRRPLSRAEVVDAWASVRHQVGAAGLVLGVGFDTPESRATRRPPVATSTRPGC